MGLGWFVPEPSLRPDLVLLRVRRRGLRATREVRMPSLSLGRTRGPVSTNLPLLPLSPGHPCVKEGQNSGFRGSPWYCGCHASPSQAPLPRCHRNLEALEDGDRVGDGVEGRLLGMVVLPSPDALLGEPPPPFLPRTTAPGWHRALHRGGV